MSNELSNLQGTWPIDHEISSATGNVVRHGQSGTEHVRPGVFLMTNSLETGGSERQFVSLARAIDPTLFSLHLGSVMEKGPFREQIGELETFGLGGKLYSVTSFRSRLRLARHLRKHRISIAHSFDFYTNLLLIPVAKVAGVSAIFGSQRQIGDLLTPSQSRAQALVFRLCDRVICNSQAAADGLRRLGVAESKLAVIRNGLPISAFTRAVPALARVPRLIRVGMIARMNHTGKNHRLFLEAAARIASRFSNVEFVLAGDGPLRPELEHLAQDLELSHRARFLGDRRDISAVLASLDISVLASGSESLSNSILESMAAGVPVVAFRVGGNAELVKPDCGLLVDTIGAQALADGIESLLRNGALRESMGGNAKSYAEACFTIGRMCHEHEQLYARILEQKRWYRNAQKQPQA